MNDYSINFPNLGIYLEYVPKSFTIFGIEIAMYGVIIALGMLFGLMYAIREAKRTGQKEDDYWDLATMLLLFSVIGARAYYVIFSWDMFKDDLLSIFNIRNGGLAIYGGIIGAIIYTWLFCRRKKIVFFNLADLGAPYLALSQSIGRWGNFVNQEAYGYETNVPWKMGIFDSAISDYIYVHPTFFYESICNFILFSLILMMTSLNRILFFLLFCRF